MSSLIPPLNYVSVDLEESERTYKAMLDSGAMVTVATKLTDTSGTT